MPTHEGPSHAHTLEALAREGLIDFVEGTPRTTRRFQGAMARAGYQLWQHGDSGTDLRVPIAWAVWSLCGGELSEDEVADRVEALLPLERRSLGLA